MRPNPSFHRTLRIKPRKAGEFRRWAVRFRGCWAAVPGLSVGGGGKAVVGLAGCSSSWVYRLCPNFVACGRVAFVGCGGGLGGRCPVCGVVAGLPLVFYFGRSWR